MHNQFRLDHRHYHHMHDPEMTEMLNLLHMGVVSTKEFIQSRIRDSIRDWLAQYPRDCWEIHHLVDRQHEIMIGSNYWLYTNNDDLATLFKLTWM